MTEIDTQEIRGKLVGKARELVSEQWEWHLRFNEDRKPAEKSKLNLYLREKGSSVELCWSRFRFMRKPDQSKSGFARYYISKGKWDKYPDGRLTKYAHKEDTLLRRQRTHTQISAKTVAHQRPSERLMPRSLQQERAEHFVTTLTTKTQQGWSRAPDAGDWQPLRL